MKSLYSKEGYTTTALTALSREITAALRPILDRWVADGYSVLEIANIMHQDVVACECHAGIKLRIAARKAKEEKEGV